MRAAAMALLAAATGAGAARWIAQPSGTHERLRGVSAADARTAWASGAKGIVVRTVNGGDTWARLPIDGAAALDFRDVEAFDAKRALVLSIGPGDASRVYRTTDGGKTWTNTFTSSEPKAFWDAFAFWDAANGFAVGDPIDGRFTLMTTRDGGASWTRVPAESVPPALEGEGAFAASGTCLAVEGSSNAWFATGGAARARVFRSTDRGATWSVADTPVPTGAPSAGIFSVAFEDARNGIVVGGDYKKEKDAGAFALTTDGGATWTAPGDGRLRGFRSAVAYVPKTRGRRLLAVGPAGTDASADGGATWSPLADEGGHALAIAPKGERAWIVGEGGSILATSPARRP